MIFIEYIPILIEFEFGLEDEETFSETLPQNKVHPSTPINRDLST